jgi:hypothetical protein
VTRAFLLVLAVLALVAAGCGTSAKPVTKTEYETQLQKLGSDLTQAGSAIGKHIDISGFNQDISNFQDHLHDAAKELHGVKPPENARDDNKRLADSFDDLADAFEPVKEARRTSIVEAGKAADTVRKSPAIANGRAAIKDLKDKGYQVGNLGAL